MLKVKIVIRRLNVNVYFFSILSITAFSMKQYHDLIKNEMTLLHFDQDISRLPYVNCKSSHLNAY